MHIKVFSLIQAIGIIEDIRTAFISNLKKKEWMDEETRLAAEEKVVTRPDAVFLVIVTVWHLEKTTFLNVKTFQ